MDHRPTLRFVACALALFAVLSPVLRATSNRSYKPGEYALIVNGRAPNGEYALGAHGEGDLGDDDFHIYLLDGKTGQKIGPLSEIVDTLDTGPDAFYAKWSKDSHEVSVTYRVDRNKAVMVRYHIEARHAKLLSGPKPVDKMPNN